jgi:nitrite reductase (NADH) small subunit
MAKRDRIKAAVRWMLVGRRDGVRSMVRSALGWFTWLDEEAAPAPSAPSEGPTGPTTGGSDDRPAQAVPEGWVAVLGVDELDDGEVIEVMVGERAVAVARVDGEWFAVDNVCPHAGGPLGDGILDGCTLTCPWHGYAYDVRSGACEVDDQLAVPTVPVKVAAGRVLLQA